ncbi:metallophosphoesterase family protein [Methanohalophilus euhalobius]|uniref:DNA double-strand break repair protein Mre11 n=1 Tax=Methanohalophilus euhalobius TaxID=51203 RepID=A0A314ZX14_9EURY|nr:exonuclease SbcCD subunit D [Methanohalophilus euhalobius]PQV43100.1 DNA repair exonuclease SbcCD nuclease subunit [Methanohalophilus euhalobius]RNI09333.1 exonuclease SbcCD subunit D [Methanohalophilus euhalobius]
MDREIRLIHTADTHIGYRQYHSDVRRRDFLEAFEKVIDDAIDMKVDAVIHAGDLFDSRNPTLEDILETIQIMSKLKAAEIPLLGIVGNHESKQQTQWLDLLENMRLVRRLGNSPFMAGNIAIYGIDSIPRPKIQSFDYSVFETAREATHNILVMHQLMKPFPFGEWDVAEVIHSFPCALDAILLGDYHKYEKTKVENTWVTYCGSTERNSAAEEEPRGYNLITVSQKGIDIGRRQINTREFLHIVVDIKDENDAYRDIFNTIREYDVKEKVVFIELKGNLQVDIAYSEIEEFLDKQGVLVSRISDLRSNCPDETENQPEIIFSDPDIAAREEIKKMDLTDAGLLIDEIIRDLSIPKTTIDHKTEASIATMIEQMDFSQEIPLNIHRQKQVESNRKEEPSQKEEPVFVEKGEDKKFRPPRKKKKETNAVDKDVEQKPQKTKVPRQYNLGDYL